MLTGATAVSLIMAAGVLLAGCGRAAPELAAGQGPPALAAGSRPYIGKPRPPVEVRLLPGSNLESGVPGRLTLQLRSGAAIEVLAVTVEGDAGLVVTGVSRPPAVNRAAGPMGAGEAATFDIDATAMSGGRRRIAGLLVFQVNGVQQGLPFSLPVEVGGPVTLPAVARKPGRPVVRDATGELVDSMQAETFVK